MESPGISREAKLNRKRDMDLELETVHQLFEEVANFQNDLMMMIKNIQFKYIKNDFQTKLKEDILNIQKCEKVLIPVDKSRNI